MLSSHFEAKQCRDSFLQSHSCNLFPVLCSVAFLSSFVRSLLLYLDLYGGIDPEELFQLFSKQVTRELAPKFAAIFRHLVKEDSFPACWRLLVGVVIEPNKSSSSDV